VTGKIAEVRGLEPGTESISPATFTGLITPEDFVGFADEARAVGGGIPIGFKLSANRIERDIDFVLEAGGRLHHPRRSRRRDGCGAAHLPRQHLGADGIAVANAAIQAVGCIGARMCNTNRCPSGVATQDPELRALIDVEASAKRVERFFGAAVSLMQTLARACGHDHLNKFHRDDIATRSKDMADLTGIEYAGCDPNRA
jgi:glutamate synthase domain-containing protein 2